MNIIEALNRLRSDIQTWTANNLKTKVNADDLSTSITTGTLSAGTIIIDGQNIKNFVDNNYVTQLNPTGSGNVSFGRKSGSSIGNKSVVIGDNSEASNDNSIAIGSGSVASGANSTVIGSGSTASGLKSVAIGEHNIAAGEYSFATGCWTTSNGVAGTALGNASITNTKSWAAVSSGIHTEAKGLVQHVFGMKNVPDADVSKYSDRAEHILIVGNGHSLANNETDNYASNAMSLDWDGNAWFSGDVYVGSASGTNKDSGSIKLATENQIPTESTVSGWGFTKNTGTITGIKMNGANKGTSGIVDLGTVITQHQDISGKVDKIAGKGLSTEDFTTALKTKLEGLNNYNDAKITESISNLQSQLNTLVNDNASDAINSFNEIIAFLDGVKDTEDLESIISSIEQQIAGKMDKITLATVATSGSYNDLSNKPTIPDAQVNSDWNATSGVSQILNKPTIPNTDTISGWGFTKTKGTVTKVSTGSGLTGGDITSTGTIKCNLVDFTQNASAASASGSDDDNRLYPVSLDKNGKLSVKVPWVKVSLSGDNAELNEALSNYITKTDIDDYIPTLNGGQEAVTGKYVSSVTVSGHTVTVTQENLPEEQYKGTVTSITPGTGLTGGSSDTAITTSGTINLKTAATGEIGGIKVGSVSTTSSGANKTINANKFAVHVDKDGLGYIAIPEYSNGTGSITKVTAGTGLTGGASSGEAILNVDIKDVNKNSKAAVKGNNSDQLYAVELDKDGKLAVSVPWKSTTFEGNAELEGLLEPYALKTDIPSIVGSGFATASSNQDTNTITVNVSVPNASTSASGLMSAADKVRLDGIEDNANNYVHPSVNHIPSGGSSGQFLKYKSSGEAQWYTLKSSDIPAHTHSYVTSVTAGEGLNNNGTDTAPSLSVKLAEDNSIGGFKTGFANNKDARNYGVKIDSSTGKAYVNVPWEAVDFSGNAELSTLLADYAKKGDIPSLSGGTGNATKKLVSGVTVSGHTVTVNQKTIAGEGTVTITDNGDTITISGADTNTDVACTEDGHYSPKTEATGVTKTASAGKYISSIKLDSKNHVVGIGEGTLPTFSESYKGTVTSITLGIGLTGASSDSAITTSGTINLKTSSTTEIGGIKVGSVGTTASNANKTVNANKFAVHVDKDGLGYVAIPAYSNNSGTITEVASGSGLTGGATSGKATLSHADTSTLEGTYGQSNNVTQSAKNTASFVVPQITVDGFGHVTGISDKTITVIDTNTTYDSLKNPHPLKFGSKSYDGSSEQTITAADLGLATALKYCGVTTTALSDGSTVNPIKINNSNHTSVAGCVVFYGSKEFVFDGTTWKELGDGSNHKIKQTAVNDPNPSGNSTTFIDTISQDENGKITVTKKNVDFPTTVENANHAATSGNADTVDGKHASDFYSVTAGTALESSKADKTDLANYLPLTGGEIKGTGAELLKVNRTNGNPVISMWNDTNMIGRLGFNATSGQPIAVTQGVEQTLIHSGNIGSQTVSAANKLVNDTTDVVIVDSNNNVGISTTTPTEKLHVVGKGLFTDNLTSQGNVTGAGSVICNRSNNRIMLQYGATGNRGIYDEPTANWLIYTNGTNTYIPAKPLIIAGKTTISNSLDVTGDITTTTSINAQNINGALSNGLEIVTDSGKVTYNGSLPRTVDLSSASENKSGVINTTNQTFAGDKTFNDSVTLKNGLHLGSATADAGTDTTKIYFGDGDCCWIGENHPDENCDHDDAFSIHAPSGVYIGDIDAETYVCIEEGAVNAPNGFYETSDARLKEFLSPINVDLDKLSKLTKSYFTWKDDRNSDRQLGVAAQEIQELYPEIVNEGKNGTLSVAYDKLSVVALAAIDQLHDENKELKNKINTLEERLAKLESLLER